MASFTTFITLALLITLCSAYKPNPCGFQFNGNPGVSCKDSKKCAAVSLRWRRLAVCLKLKLPNCICTLEFAPVCCRVNISQAASITQTEGNKCGCDCIKGKVLFKRACNDPPLTPAVCTEEFNSTCCYIKKFDLTYTASNPCICKKQARGIITSDKFCGIKN